MRYWHLLLILLLVTRVNAQSYLPLPDSNAVWFVGFFGYGSNSIIKIQGDSIYNAQSYKKYYLSRDTTLAVAQFTHCALIRQDIPNKRVYGISNNSNQEKLLYDFSLGVNDTATVYNFDWIGNGAPRKIKVIQKDSLLLNGQYRKRLYITGNGWWAPGLLFESWIEGIGSTYGVLNNGICDQVVFDGCYPSLVCNKVNGFEQYNSGSANCFAKSCGFTWTGFFENHVVHNSVVLYPNPVNSELSIKWTMIMSQMEIVITDLIGNILYKKFYRVEGKNEQEITLNEFEQGCYFLKVFESSKLIATKKFIKN